MGLYPFEDIVAEKDFFKSRGMIQHNIKLLGLTTREGYAYNEKISNARLEKPEDKRLKDMAIKYLTKTHKDFKGEPSMDKKQQLKASLTAMGIEVFPGDKVKKKDIVAALKKVQADDYAKQAARYMWFIIKSDGSIDSGWEDKDDGKTSLKETLELDPGAKLVSRMRVDKNKLNEFFKGAGVTPKMAEKSFRNVRKEVSSDVLPSPPELKDWEVVDVDDIRTWIKPTKHQGLDYYISTDNNSWDAGISDINEEPVSCKMYRDFKSAYRSLEQHLQTTLFRLKMTSSIKSELIKMGIEILSGDKIRKKDIIAALEKIDSNEVVSGEEIDAGLADTLKRFVGGLMMAAILMTSSPAKAADLGKQATQSAQTAVDQQAGADQYFVNQSTADDGSSSTVKFTKGSKTGEVVGIITTHIKDKKIVKVDSKVEKTKVDNDFLKSFEFMANGAEAMVGKSMEKVCTPDQCKMVMK